VYGRSTARIRVQSQKEGSKKERRTKNKGNEKKMKSATIIINCTLVSGNSLRKNTRGNLF
jgi:hypothetical protein